MSKIIDKRIKWNVFYVESDVPGMRGGKIFRDQCKSVQVPIRCSNCSEIYFVLACGLCTDCHQLRRKSF